MLTDKEIRDAKPKETVYRIRDNSVCKGLGIVVAPNGNKTFFVSFTSPEDGKRKQISIGKYPRLKLASARLKGLELREKIDDGVDLAREKIHNVEESMKSRSLGNFEDLIDLYIEDLRLDGKRSAKEVERIKKVDLPKNILGRPANKITRDDILDILSKIAQRGARVHSDNVRTYLRAAFELGINVESKTRWRGKVLRFDLRTNVVASIKKTVVRKQKGMRFLNEEEVHEMWNSNLLTQSMHLALKLILSSGQRVEEVLGAEWQEFDFKKKLWTIPGERRKSRNKTNEPHLIPLSDLHLELLDEIKKITKHRKFLFPAKNLNAPRRFDALTKAVRVFVKTSSMLSFSPRDLRRTFKTLTGSMNIPLEIRNRLQGHSLTDIGSVYYDRFDYLDQKREAMEKWTAGLRKIIEKKDSDD